MAITNRDPSCPFRPNITYSMAMMARGLSSVRSELLLKTKLYAGGGARALYLSESRSGASISSAICYRMRLYSAAASAAARAARGQTTTTTTATTTTTTTAEMGTREISLLLTRRFSSFRSSLGSGSFDKRAGVPADCRLSSTKAAAAVGLLRRGGGGTRGAGYSSRYGAREWRSVASFRATASASGPDTTAGAGGSNNTTTASSSTPAAPRQTAAPSAASAVAAEKISPTDEKTPKAAKGDNGATVKGGNPALRDGRFGQMRERIRQSRLDASEDARDWIRDKRDGMETIKESLRDARQDLRAARRDGRLGAELSEQAKEGSGRLQVLWKKYGVVAIGTYFGIYFGSIAIFYVVYDYGVLTNLPSGGTAVIEHMQDLMKHAPEWAQGYSDRLFGAMVEDHRARSFILAWATCKVIEPLRLVATVGVTPMIARAVGRAPARVPEIDGTGDGDDGEEEKKKRGGS